MTERFGNARHERDERDKQRGENPVERHDPRDAGAYERANERADWIPGGKPRVASAITKPEITKKTSTPISP
ncbi:hypothetical protein OKW30_002790 [Paraburkholderia sp. Clong3]